MAKKKTEGENSGEAINPIKKSTHLNLQGEPVDFRKRVKLVGTGEGKHHPEGEEFEASEVVAKKLVEAGHASEIE